MPRPRPSPAPAVPPSTPVAGPEGLRAHLAAIRATLAILVDHGAAVPPAKVAAYLDAIERAAEPYLRGLSEPNAQRFTGFSARWLRARYAGLAARGLAWTRAGVRYYAECALPHRHDNRRSQRRELGDVAELADELLTRQRATRATGAPRLPRVPPPSRRTDAP